MSNKRILFVCMGNICRSPAGEGVFRALVDERGLADVIDIDSAGTIGYHAGSPADMRMQVAARQRGYELTSIARQVTRADLEDYDLVIAMDRENLLDLESLAGDRKSCRAELRMLGSFLEGVDSSADAPDVPDPYYGGEAGFERVLDMIEAACPAILEYLTERPDESPTPPERPA